MKKIYLFVLSLGLLGTAMAQNSFEDQGMERNMLRLNDNTISAEEVKTDMYGDSRAAFGPFWVNFPSWHDQLTGDRGGLTLSRIFPDSLPRITSTASGDIAYNRFQNSFYSVGQVFDFASKVFADGTGKTEFNGASSFTVDSLDFLYSYGRNQNTTDTLRIAIFKSGATFFNFEVGADPRSFLAYDGENNMPGTPDSEPYATYDILLTDADSANLLYSLDVDVELAAGERMAVTFNYHPGFTYDAGDNLYTDLNYLSLYSFEEVTGSDAMVSRTYEDSATFNQGLFTDDWNRYGIDTSIFGDYYYDGYSNAPYSSADHIYVSAKVSGDGEAVVIDDNTGGDDDDTGGDDDSTGDDDDTTGGDDDDTTGDDTNTSIDELAIIEGLDIYPNPANGMININFVKAADVAGNAIRIFNLVGDLVYVNENPSFNNQINVATFTAGVYTVRVGTVAKKVIIK